MVPTSAARVRLDTQIYASIVSISVASSASPWSY